MSIQSVYLVVDPMAGSCGRTGSTVPNLSVVISPLAALDGRGYLVSRGNSFSDETQRWDVPDDPGTERAATGLMGMVHHHSQRMHLAKKTFDSERGRDIASVTGITGRQFRPGKLQDQFLYVHQETFLSLFYFK